MGKVAKVREIILTDDDPMVVVASLYNHYDDLQAILDRYEKLSPEEKVKHKKYKELTERRVRITLMYIENIDQITGGE